VKPKNLKLRGGFFILCALAGFALASLDKTYSLLGVGIAVASLLVAGTTFSTASQLANSLQSFVKRSARIEVWGVTLSTSDSATFEIDSIFALGAGLLIYLRSTPGGPPTQLKVAQPKSASVVDGRLEVGDAAYISWGGKQLARAAAKKTPALSVVTLG
jgi:hypothetical protein